MSKRKQSRKRWKGKPGRRRHVPELCLVYDLGACVLCGRPVRIVTPYGESLDPLDDELALCASCAERRLVVRNGGDPGGHDAQK